MSELRNLQVMLSVGDEIVNLRFNDVLEVRDNGSNGGKIHIFGEGGKLLSVIHDIYFVSAIYDPEEYVSNTAEFGGISSKGVEDLASVFDDFSPEKEANVADSFD